MATTNDAFGPSPTNHAELRWTQRSHVMDQSIRQAWEESQAIGPQYHGDIDGDEVRFHEQTETLLFECDNHITTVLKAEYVGERPSIAIKRLRGGDAQ